MKIQEKVCLDLKSLTKSEDAWEQSYPVHHLAGTVSWKVSYLLKHCVLYWHTAKF